MTKICLTVVLSLAATLAPSIAEDWTTTDGKTYKDVKVLKVDPDAVDIMDADGGGLVPLDKLSPDLQKRFNYDPAKAKIAAAQRKLDENASLQAEIAERQSADEKKNQEEAQALAADQQKAADQAAMKSATPLVFEVTQVLPDGVLADKMKAEYEAPVADSMASVGGGGNVAAGGGVSYTESGNYNLRRDFFDWVS